MKINALTGIVLAFVGLVGAAGYLLVREPAPKATVVSEQSDKPVAGADFAKPGAQPAAAPAAKPRDERFVIKRVLPITGPIKYGE